MKSCFYSGQIFHKRFQPKAHSFQYEMDYLFLSLAELDELCGLSKWWSKDSSNLISFRRQDYLPGDLPLDQQVKSSVTQLGGSQYNGDTFLLTTPRRLGHCMNPITLFYCFHDEQLRYVLAEVHNTPWDERHLYLLEGPDFRAPTLKDFHVSPFMPMETTYKWNISDPKETHKVAIHVSHESADLFTASMDLMRQPINAQTMSAHTKRQLRQSFRTLTAIYIQALKLWLKRTPFFRHPEKIKLQETNS